MKKLLLLIILAGAVGAAAYYWNRSRVDAPAPVALGATYEDAEAGYALSYPASFDREAYDLGNVVFGPREDSVVRGVVEVRPLAIPGAPGETLQDAVVRELASLCAADGPDASIACSGAEQVQPFTTESGIEGFVLYLAAELTTRVNGQTTTFGKGPYFVLPMMTGATATRVLVIHPPLSQTAEEADASAIRAVAASVRWIAPAAAGERPAQTIDDFVRANISRLSPEPEVLGGTYYVTSIEAQGGTGVVSYEDGHMAYTADFTYSVSPAGVPSVDSFTIRR